VRYDLGLAHYRLGEIDRELGDYAAAEDSLTRAVGILDVFARAHPDVTGYHRDLAASYAALGLVHSNTGSWQKADWAYQQALTIQEKLAAANPEAPEYQYALAKTYSALGLVYQFADQTENAATMSQQAHDILSKLVQAYPLVSEYRSLLAATQMNLGQVYVMKGWHDKAETVLKEAKNNYGKLVEAGPDDLPENRESLGRSHTILAMAYRGGNQVEKGEEELQQALRIFEELAREHPDVPEYAYDVGRCHIELGSSADAGKRPEAALEQFAKAIEIMEQAAHKGYRKARHMALFARIHRAGVQAKQGEHARATQEMEALLRQGDVAGIHVYDVACGFCLAWTGAEKDTKLSPTERKSVKTRYADRAMELLRQAVAKGYRNQSIIKEDHDLDPLRAREDFQELLADLEAKTKE
jgi:tetratricopeptide (TPR) repeat protein